MPVSVGRSGSGAIGNNPKMPPVEATQRQTQALRAAPVSASALSGTLLMRFMDEYGDILYDLCRTTEASS